MAAEEDLLDRLNRWVDTPRIFIPFAAVAAVLVVFGTQWARAFFDQPREDVAGSRAAITAGAVAAAYLLFLLRKHIQLFYGMAELAFGVGFLYFSLGQWSDDPQVNLVSTLAAMYLLVRAMVNVSDGRKGKSWRRIFGRDEAGKAGRRFGKS